MRSLQLWLAAGSETSRQAVQRFATCIVETLEIRAVSAIVIRTSFPRHLAGLKGYERIDHGETPRAKDSDGVSVRPSVRPSARKG